MIFLYNEDEVIGKFDEGKTTKIAYNKEYDDSRWDILLRTAMGNYVIKRYTCWQGEHDLYIPISRAEALDYMEKWGYDEGAIKKEFPEYVQKDTY